MELGSWRGKRGKGGGWHRGAAPGGAHHDIMPLHLGLLAQQLLALQLQAAERSGAVVLSIPAGRGGGTRNPQRCHRRPLRPTPGSADGGGAVGTPIRSPTLRTPPSPVTPRLPPPHRPPPVVLRLQELELLLDPFADLQNRELEGLPGLRGESTAPSAARSSRDGRGNPRYSPGAAPAGTSPHRPLPVGALRLRSGGADTGPGRGCPRGPHGESPAGARHGAAVAGNDLRWRGPAGPGTRRYRRLRESRVPLHLKQPHSPPRRGPRPLLAAAARAPANRRAPLPHGFVTSRPIARLERRAERRGGRWEL